MDVHSDLIQLPSELLIVPCIHVLSSPDPKTTYFLRLVGYIGVGEFDILDGVFGIRDVIQDLILNYIFGICVTFVNIFTRMNIRIYLYKQILHKRMSDSEYIRKKNYTDECRNKYL